jgi:GTP-binding protein
MIPIIAIVGRPNVGKSTLFNCLTKSRAALVADQPGLTRDRKYGEGQIGEQSYIVIDTGGLEGEEECPPTTAQTLQAIKEADAILFVVDGKQGLTHTDEIIANKLRRLHKSVFLTINKTDSIDINTAVAEFYSLGLGDPIPISAAHRRGITALLEKILTTIPIKPEPAIPKPTAGIKIAFIGKPNVGKSTLINRILGEERVIVYDQPGTTRDSIFVPFARGQKNYILIDTAGIRRRHRRDALHASVEKFSIIKSLQAIEESHVVVLIIDAHENITEQDLRLLRFILEAGKALVIAVNKLDGLEKYKREQVRKELDRRLVFLDFVEIHFISALHGTGVGNLFPAINRAYKSASKKLSTPELTRILERLVKAHEPPLVKKHRIKLRYAHVGGQNPPVIVIHGKRVTSLPAAYRRYLEKSFRKALNLVGTPIRFVFRCQTY